MEALDLGVTDVVKLSVLDGAVNFFLADVLDGVHELSVHVVVIDDVVVYDDDFFDSKP